MREPLTKKQSAILEYVLEYVRQNDFAPTYREIGEHFGISSTATVHEHVKNLEAKGYLSSRGDVARSIDVAPVSQSVAATFLPLAGLITAGEPIEALQTMESIEVPGNLGGGDCFVLKVRGDSMSGDGILSGDLVVIEKNDAPPDGEMVVALIDGTHATLKRLYREKGRIRLQPSNPTMKPIYAKNVTVQGVVRGLIRGYAR